MIKDTPFTVAGFAKLLVSKPDDAGSIFFEALSSLTMQFCFVSPSTPDEKTTGRMPQ
ncbi:hypothetical protein RRSWK_02395 [Rhodopirellula sp. SWK7]|nr:hypothetical protein RRSWK_02395 [Rhodopirellula sp. SWK7]